jgi:hypothetical protein
VNVFDLVHGPWHTHKECHVCKFLANDGAGAVTSPVRCRRAAGRGDTDGKHGSTFGTERPTGGNVRTIVFVRRLAAVAIAMLTVLTTAVTPAAADVGVLAGCRAAPYSATFSQPLNLATVFLPSATGEYTTTSQCSDIQIRTSVGDGWACVIFTQHTTECNYWSGFAAGYWANVATNVKDGTKFRIEMIDINANDTYFAGVAEF